MTAQTGLSREAPEDFEEIERTGRGAVERARAGYRRLGIPSASFRNGTLSVERPDGTTTQGTPFVEENADGAPTD
jgi:hypothetical protein